jgi:predicted RNase H-like nuclease
VYPHPALLTLLGCDERVRYKVRRSSRYWPRTTIAERVSSLLEQFDRINVALGAVIGGALLQLPAAARTRSLAELKRYEDALDALISAWVGARYSTGQAAAYGDETAAIWIPRSDT